MKICTLFAMTLVLYACGGADKPRDVEPLDPTDAARATMKEARDRLFADHVVADRCLVVTRKPDGSPEHLGEARLWCGIALAHLPCDDTAFLMADLVRELHETGGRIRRMEPLPETYVGREWNFDGETVLQYGIASYVTRCEITDTELVAIGEAWKLHTDAVQADGALYPGTGETMPEPFGFVGRALAAGLGLTAERPPTSELRTLERAAETWAWSLHVQKSACYRAHLAFRHLLAAERLGYDVDWHKPPLGGFCGATRGMKIPNIDHRCGRSPLADWAKGFVWNEWEMRHQRCAPPWESPDGDGDQTPGLDLIEGLDDGYKLRP